MKDFLLMFIIRLSSRGKLYQQIRIYIDSKINSRIGIVRPREVFKVKFLIQ
jgi:hypothetical protein